MITLEWSRQLVKGDPQNSRLLSLYAANAEIIVSEKMENAIKLPLLSRAKRKRYLDALSEESPKIFSVKGNESFEISQDDAEPLKEAMRETIKRCDKAIKQARKNEEVQA